MIRTSTFGAVCAAGILAASASEAQDVKQETALACLNAGLKYQVGEFACIAACHQQRRLARCDLVSEVTSWTYVSDACPSAMIINPPWPSDWSEVPAVSAMSPIPVTVIYSALPPQPAFTLAGLN